tara:strand:- start:1893 stop:3290 length:1398 start_codon:yes stop_codon:yes gene_type:complete
MSVSIEQSPLYNILPIGQQVIFTVSEPTIVATKFNVKFVAQIHVDNQAIVLANNSDLIGTFKTTPNNAGVGIFDLRPILETFIKPDHEPNSTIIPASDSQYKGTSADSTMFPIHLVDRFSLSNNSIKYFAINFYIEYSDTATGEIINFLSLPPTPTALYIFFNGVLQYDDVLKFHYDKYGYYLEEFYFSSSIAKFLSDAPTTQYAKLTDYGTFPILNYVPNANAYPVTGLDLTYYNSSGVQLATENVNNQLSTGGPSNLLSSSDQLINYFGGFPANLDGWSSTWDLHKANISYYTIRDENNLSALYTIHILCSEIKGYEGVRLTWLNKWGTWDYYTFNMKSTRSIATNRTSYTQLGGTWNESIFRIAGYKGGKKNFRVNSTEKIRINTDFVTEEEGIWFEQLINSSEVYVLEGLQTDPTSPALNTYVQPATITSSSYTRKTRANDNLMQYTFEIEKSKMKRTQSV